MKKIILYALLFLAVFVGNTHLSHVFAAENLTYGGGGEKVLREWNDKDSINSFRVTSSYDVNASCDPAPLGSNSPICAGSTLTLTASDINGSPTYSWTGPNGFVSFLQNPTIPNATTAASGTYTVTATKGGCVTSATIVVVVNAIPTASAGSNSPVCNGSAINLTAVTVTGATYHWTGPNTYLSNIQNPVISPASPANAGTYSLTVTKNGCTSPASTTNVVVSPVPVTSATSNSPVCVGGAINLSSTAGSPTAIYSWTSSTGYTSNIQNPTITNATLANAGSYTVVLKEGNCTSTPSTVNVVVNSPPTTVAGSNSPVCAGNSINLTSTAGSGSAIYSWTGPNGYTSSLQNPVITNASTANTGAYNVTLTDGGCTSNIGTVNVTVNSLPVAIVGSNSPVCIGNAINLTASGGSASATYSWTGPNGFTSNLQNPTISPATLAKAGTYSVILTDNSCSSTATPVTVSVIAAPNTTAGSNSPVCTGGTISLTSTAGSASATYSWTGPNGFTSTLQNPTLTNVTTAAAGTYSVILSEGTCSSSSSPTVVTVNSFVSTTAGSNSPVCIGNTINLTSSAGSAAATYSWTGPNGFTSTQRNVSIPNASAANAGDYTVILTDGSCTSQPSTVTVVVNSGITTTAGSNSPVCIGNTINLTSSAGSTGATYSWTGPNGFTSTLQNPTIPNATLAAAGSYSVILTQGSCSSPANSVTVSVISAPTTTASSNSPVCPGGTINLSSTAGSASATYSWTGPNGFTSTLRNPTIPNATAANAGSYSVILSEGSCSSSPSSVSVSINSGITTTAGSNSPVCVGNTINLTSTPGSASATYSWTGPNGFTSNLQNPVIPSATAAAAGTYTVILTDGSCTSAPSNVTVVVNSALNTTAGSNSPVCVGNTINLTSTAGSASATYSWTGPNGFTSTFQNPSITNATAAKAGVYSVILTDGGCSSPASTVTVNVTPAPTTTAGSNSPVCIGGAINLTSSAGTGTATYSWTGPNGFASALQNPTISNATAANAGVYSVVLSEGTCSSAPSSITVTVGSGISTTAGSNSPVCLGNTINLTSTSGGATATYSWTGPNGYTSSAQNPSIPNASAADAGTYSVVLTVGSCTSAPSSVVVNVNSSITTSAGSNNPVCQGGTINLTSTAGSATASYSWTGPNGFSSTLQNPAITNASLAAAGTYSVVLTEGSCVSSPATVNVTIVPVPITNAGSNSPVCIGNTINLTSTAGSATATYSWTGPNGFTSTSQNPSITGATAAKAGTYSVVLSEGTCSSIPATVTVTVNPSPSTSASSNSPVCIGSTINLSSTAGSASASYSWSGPNGFTSTLQNPTISNAGSADAGTYSVVLTDGGCSSVPASVTVAVNSSITTSAGSNSPVCIGSTINLTSTSGGGSATYSWTGPNGFTSALQNPTVTNASAADAGVYSVVLTQGSCSSAPSNVTVTVNPAIITTAGSNSPICSGGSINLTSTPGSASANYSWTGPNGFTSSLQNPVITNATGASDGTYSVTLTDGACTSAPSTVTVSIIPLPITTAGSNSPVCIGNSIDLTSTAGSGTATYSWTGPNGFSSSLQNPIISNASAADAGIYSVVLTEGSCSSASSQVTVSISSGITTTAGSNSPVCLGSSINLTSTAGSASAVYSWTGPNGFTSSLRNPVISNATAAEAGDYTVTRTEGSCTSSPSTVTVSVSSSITTTAGSNSPVCTGSTISLTSTAGSASAIYSWTGPNGYTSSLQNPTIPNASSANAGTYSVVLKEGSCTSSASSVIVSLSPIPTTNAGSNSPVCVGSTINLTSTAGSGTASYSWTGPNGFTSNQQNPSVANVSAADAGTYTVILTDGACSSLPSNVNVVVNPIPVTAAGSNSPVCTGGTINLISTAGSGSAVYNWTGPNGFTSNLRNPTIPNVTAANDGIYAVTLTDGGCSSIPSNVTVTVNSGLTTSAGSNSPVCIGGTINLTSTAGSASAVYSWTGPNGFTSTQQNPVKLNASLADAGTYSVVLTEGSCSSLVSSVTVSINTSLTTTAGSNSPVCTGATINLTSTAGSASATYTWTGPNGFTSNVQNPIITNATVADGGTYSVVLKEGTCSSLASSVNVVVNAIPTTTAGSNTPVCSGSSINLNSTAGSASAIYSWTGPNGFTSNAQNPVRTNASSADAGTYSVILTEGSCSSSPSTVTVVVNPIPMTSAGSNSPICGGSPINLTSTAGSASATYSWTGPNGFTSSFQNPTIPNASSSNAGTYSVILTDNNCASIAKTVTVNVNPIPTTTAVSNSPVCVGDDINLSSTAGSASATYSWTGPNGFTSNLQNPTITNVTASDAGTYSVILTEGTCTSLPSSVVVNINSFITTTAASNNPVCQGSSINLTSTAGATGATYSWTGPNGFTSNLQNPTIPNAGIVNAGDYSVVLSVGSCTSDPSTVTVAVNPKPVTSAGSNSPVCIGSSLNLSSSAGSATATYSWTGPNGFTSNFQNPTVSIVSAANAGTYSVVLSEGSCSSLASSVTVVVKPIPTTTASSNSPVCIGNSINLSSTAGTATAVYSWTGPNGFTSNQRNPSIANASAAMAGVYSVILTEGTCSSSPSTVTVSINSLPSTTAASNSPVCVGNTLNLTSTAGSATAVYSWTGPNSFTSNLQNPTIPNVSAAAAGNYSVTLTEGSCTSVASNVIVNINSAILTSAGSNSPVCNGGTINLVSTAGSASAIYSWTGPNGFTSNLQNPAIVNASSANAGNYSVVLTEGSCSSAPSTIAVTVTPSLTTVAASNSPVCAGSTINLTSTAGSATASYSWTGPNGYTSNIQNPVITNAGPSDAGIYSVVLTDGTCSSSPSTVNVSVTPIPSTIAGSNSPLCIGSTISLTSTAGSASATYNWTGPNGYTSTLQNPTISNASAVNAGTYSVILKEGSCSSAASSVTVNINSSITTVAGSNSPVCTGSTIRLTSSFGDATATYSWTGPNGFTSNLQNPTIINATAINAGNYSVVLTEGNCISAPSTITVDVSTNSAITTVAGSNSPVCQGGTINLTSTAGGATATYSWTGPNGFTSNLQNPTISNASSAAQGTYSVILTEGTCTSSPSTVTVNINPIPTGTASSNSPVCAGSTIRLNSSGGGATATYNWTGPNGYTANRQNPTISPATVSQSGTYNVTITENSCTSVPTPVTVVVNAVPSTAAGSNSPVCIGSSINLVSTAGGASASYSWIGPNGFTSSLQNPSIPSASAASAGNYSVVLTENNCSSLASTVRVNVSPVPSTNAQSNSPICSGNSLNLTSTAGGATASYSWTGPNGFTSNLRNPIISNASVAASGTYSVILTENNCSSPASTVVVNVLPSPSTVAGSNSPICAGDVLLLTSTQGGATATYSWTGPNGFTSSLQNPAISPAFSSAAGNYTVVLTEGNCSSTASTVSITVTPVPSTSATSNSPVCTGSSINLTSASGSATAMYSWIGPNDFISSEQNPVITSSSVADAGTYSVTLTEGTCSSDPSDVDVIVNQSTFTTAGSNSPVCSGSSINLTSTAGSGTATYSWTGPNGFTSNLQNPIILNATSADAGNYRVILSDGNCTSSPSTVNVSVGNAITTTASSNSPVCVGSTINLSSTAGSSNAIYSWTGPNGFTSALQNPVIPSSTLANAGDYTVTLTDGTCPAATSTVTVNVGNSITTTASSNSPVCVGSAINLNSTAGSSNATYSWTGPNGFTSAVQNPVIPTSTLASAGDYTVTLTDGSCPAATSTVTVSVGNSITTTASSNSPVCVGSAINLSSTAGSSNATYSWTGPNGFTSAVQNPVIPTSTLASAGDYTVTLTDGSCPAATSTVTVSVGNSISTTASSNSPVCVGSAINLSSTAGSSNAIYSWTGPNGFTSAVQNPVIPTATLANAGDYTVTLTDGACPAATSTVTVSVGNSITTTASSNSPVCVGGPINLSSTAGSSNATYSWTGPNGFTSALQNPVIPTSTLASAGDYTVTLTDGSCPAATSTVTVSVGNAITTTASSNSPVCVGSAINLSSTAGSSNATYSWTGPNGFTSAVQNPVIPTAILANIGDYTVTLTDGACPAATSTVTVSVGNSITTTASSNSPVCVGSAINLSSTAGSSNATYSWTGPNGFTSAVQNPVIPTSTLASAGDYTVTLTDGSCPAATSTVTVSVGNSISTTASSNSPVCVGSAINLSSTAGSSNAIYSWTGPNGFTSAVQNPVIPTATLANAGDYTVTLTDGACPAATSTVTVSVGNSITTTASSNSPVCVGGPINLSSTAGSSNATYSWTGPNGFTSALQNPVIPTSTLASAGDYTVTLTDGSCPAATSTVTVSVGNAITTTASSNSPVCVGSAINLSSTAGSSNATYSWTGPNGFTSAVQNPVIPTAILANTGDYTVTLTDGACPAATSTVTVSVGNSITTTASSNSPVCVGSAINLSSTAGSSNATYSWTGPNGFTSSVQNPVIPSSTSADAGDYTVTLTDGACPAATSTVTVSVGNSITTTASSNSPVCVGSAINLSSTAGSSNATYSWTGPNGFTSSVQNPVIPTATLANTGDYTVTLTDGTCPAATSTVTVNVFNAIGTIASSNSPVCVGSPINLSSTAGSINATYSWTGPNGFTSAVQNPVIPASTLADAGDYTVTLTDGTCPAATSTVTVSVGNAITTTASSNSPVCVGSAINLSSTPGSSNATYSWTGPNGFTSAVQNPMVPSSTLANAGDYTVTLTDGTCPAATSTVTVSVGNSITTTASSNSPVCVGSAINLSSTAGSSNATYSWTGPNGFTSSVQNPVIPSSTSADAGDYTVTLTDGSCPAATSTVTVSVGSSITTTASSNSPVCVGSAINLSSTAGSSNATYSWTGPNGFTSSVQNPVIPTSTLASAGDYTVTLTDGTCPAATSTVTVNVGNSITTTASSNSPVCVGSPINLSSTAGSSNATYSWTGPNGFTSAVQNPVIPTSTLASAGDYTVTLTDGSCPAATSTVTVSVGNSITTIASSNSPVCVGSAINLSSTAGSSNATYSWTGPNGFTSALQNPVIPTATLANAGDYTVTLTDGACPAATSTVTVSVGNSITTITSSNSPVCVGSAINLSSTAGSSNATYSWSGPNGFTSAVQNPVIPTATLANAGDYTVTLTDGACPAATSTVTVSVGNSITTTASSNSPVCVGSAINLSSTAGSSNATYSWTGPNGFISSVQNPVIPSSTSADAGDYTVTLTDGTCPAATSTVTVSVGNSITTTASSNSPVCVGSAINLSSTAGSSNATYSWSGPNGFTSAVQNPVIPSSTLANAGDYTVTLTDGTCPAATSTVTVSVGNSITTTASSNSPVCVGSAINLSSTAGSSNATYSWTGPNGFTSAVQNPVIPSSTLANAGDYTVTLTDGTCPAATSTVTVSVGNSITTTASSNSPVCVGSAINLSSTAGSSNATYSWTGPNGFTSSVQNPIITTSTLADAGDYTVTLTDGTCPAATSTVTVSVGNAITTTASSNSPVCVGSAINLSSTAGSSNAIYSWTGPNGFTSALQNPVIPSSTLANTGDYTVTLTDGTCPAATSTVTVSVGNSITTTASSNSPVCVGSAINLSSTAGSSNAIYSWTGPNGFTSALQNPVIPASTLADAGDYTVTLTDGTCPAATSTVTVNVFNAIGTIASSNSPVCVGSPINLSSTAGSINATYSWTGPNGFTSAVQNPVIPTSTLANAGDYTVTLTDGTCPAATSTVTVSVGNSITTTASSNSPVCVGGAINLSSTAESSNATYSWTGPNGFTSAVQNPVIPTSTLANAGDYTVTLTDGTCPVATSTVTVNVGSAISTTAGSNSPVCLGNTINLSSTVGSSNATYSWTGPNGFTSSVQNPVIPSSTSADAGDYTVTLTDGTCPAATSTITVSVGNAITTAASSNSPVCVGNSINLISTAGSATASYSWTGPNGFTSNLQNPVIPNSSIADAGDYTIVLTEGTCSSIPKTVTVSVGSMIVTNAASNNPVCYGDTIILTSTAGSSAATYNWTGPNGYTSNVQNPFISNATPINSGDYTVILTDGSCVSSPSTVTVNVGSVVVTNAGSNSPICLGSTLNLNSSSGTGTATYSWTGPNGFISSQQNPSITNVSAANSGDYIIVLKEGNCSSAPDTVTVSVNPAIVTAAGSNSPVCIGSSINLTSTAGSSTATYSWTGPNGFTSNVQNPVITNSSSAEAGNYTVVLTEGNCSSSASIVTVDVNSFITTIAESNSPVCIGNPINLSATGSSTATYSWTGPNGFTSSSPTPAISSASSTDAGDYTVTITDGTCTSAPSTVTVTVGAAIATTASSNSPVCDGGTLNLSSTAGSAAATYSWTGPNGFTSSVQNPSISNSSAANAGTYYVVLTDGNCTSQPSSIVVDINSPVITMASSNSPVCIGSSINLISTAGSSTASYSWTGPNGFTSTLQNPSIPNSSSSDAGNYSVTLTEGNCASAPSAVTVSVGSIILTSAGNNSPVCSGTTINLTSTAGSANAIYSWTGPNGFTSALQNPVIPNANTSHVGTYSVILTEGNCTSAPSTVTVAVNSVSPTTAGSNSPVCNGSTINLTSTVGSSTAIYSWTGPNGFTSSSQNPVIQNAGSANTGDYTVTLTEGNCSSAPNTVTVSVGPVITTTAGSNSPVCIGSSINLTSSAGSSTASYSWTGPNGFASNVQNPVIQNSSKADSGKYTVILTEGVCSSAPNSVNVSVGSVISAIASSNSPVCIGNTINLAVTSGGSSASYSWTGPHGFTSNVQNPKITNADTTNSGTYSVVITEGNCASPASTVKVTVNPAIIVSANSNSPVCNGSTINLTASTGSSTATYSWTGPNGFTSTSQNPVIQNAGSVNAGNYSVIVSDGNCTSASTNVSIAVNPLVTTTAGSNNPVCIGSPIELTSSAGSSTAIYSWTGPNGFTSNVQNPAIQNSDTVNSGVYTVTLTEGNCSSKPSSVTVKVNSTITTIAGSNSPVCNGSQINLTSSAGGSTATYNWTGPNGFTSNQKNPTISNADASNVGTYSLVVKEGTCTSPVSSITVTVNPVVTTVALSNSPVCSGSTINLSSTLGSDTAKYSWTGPNGFTSTLQNPVIQNSGSVNTGSYTVILTEGKCASKPSTISVNVNPAVSTTASSNSPVCNADTIFLTSTAGSSAATYSWTGPNGFNSNVQNPVIQNADSINAGTYSVVLSEGKCSSAVSSVTVNIKPKLTTVASSNNPICAGSQVNLTSTSGSATATYTWVGPHGYTSTEQNPVITNATLADSGVYSVILTEGNCSSKAAAIRVNINSLSINKVSSNSPICEGSNLSLNTTGDTTSIYSWTGPDGFASSVQNPVISNIKMVNAGTYNLTVASKSCSTNVSMNVVVNAVPVINMVSDSLCLGDSITLTASPAGQNYIWSTSQAGESISAKPIRSGTAKYSVKVSNSACKTPATEVSLQVLSPIFSFANRIETSCFAKSVLELNAPIKNSSYSYSWLPVGKTGDTIHVSSAGTYTLMVTDNFGCTAKDSVKVEEVCEPTFFIPKAFTPNSDGINDSLAVFYTYVKDFEITIFNRWGEAVYQFNGMAPVLSNNSIGFNLWDGTFKGERLGMETFAYIIKYNSLIPNDPKNPRVRRGFVANIR